MQQEMGGECYIEGISLVSVFDRFMLIALEGESRGVS